MTSELPFPIEDRFYRFGRFILKKFGERVQKVSVDAGFTCPNRDGSISTGGCIYCNNASFTPEYARHPLSVKEQLRSGIEFLEKRYHCKKFFAYFQPFTNTYAPVSRLRKLYYEALEIPEVAGLIIGTRADCIDEETWSLLVEIAREKFVSLEIGIESVYNHTLQWMNRGHDFASVIKAVERAKQNDIFITGHIILGFPVETREEMFAYAEILNSLNPDSLKIHHLQIVRDTPLEKIYRENPFPVWEEEEYITFIANFLERLDPGIIIQRLTGDVPRKLLIAPLWKSPKNKIINKIVALLEDGNSFQGKLLC